MPFTTPASKPNGRYGPARLTPAPRLPRSRQLTELRRDRTHLLTGQGRYADTPEGDAAPGTQPLVRGPEIEALGRAHAAGSRREIGIWPPGPYTASKSTSGPKTRRSVRLDQHGDFVGPALSADFKKQPMRLKQLAFVGGFIANGSG
jgi:hypothetical protein